MWKKAFSDSKLFIALASVSFLVLLGSSQAAEFSADMVQTMPHGDASRGTKRQNLC
jgi:hypothetical protein